jgi:phospholipid transport system transporter-binding protein
VITCEDHCCRFDGALTVDSIGGLLRELQPQLANGVNVLDFSAVESADSAALALIFSAMRYAQQAGSTLSLVGLPASFATLAELYGVTELLPT